MTKISVFLLFLLSGFLVAQDRIKQDTKSEAKIEFQISQYSPIMSSTVGIPLQYSGKISPEMKCYWHANYGHFLSWKEPDYKVKFLGSDVVNSGEKLYWSYRLEDTEKPAKIEILVMVIDLSKREIVATAHINIGWKDNMAVVVEK